MIGEEKTREMVHALLDNLQDSGSRHDYYLVNSASSNQVDVLVLFVAAWLKVVGVKAS